MAMREKMSLNIARNSYEKWYPMDFSRRIMLALLKLHHVFQQILKALLKNKLKKYFNLPWWINFQVNDDESWHWGVKGQHVIRPKSRGGETMVSDFIDEYNWYLRLTEELSATVKETHSFEGKPVNSWNMERSIEGYWTAEKFLKQLEVASTIADIKYPRNEEYSSCHGTYAEGA